MTFPAVFQQSGTWKPKEHWATATRPTAWAAQAMFHSNTLAPPSHDFSGAGRQQLSRRILATGNPCADKREGTLPTESPERTPQLSVRRQSCEASGERHQSG